MLSLRGFPLSELDEWNTGMLFDWCYEVDRIKRKANGQKDDYDRYQTMKKIEPEIDEQYANGQINEEKYRSFKETIANYEKRMR